ncbi:serine/threonine protein phosphatase [Macrococcus sp. DPC7161]|nr:serine/threonine protein phosphatase [Macrococcus sp. DPC7161]
MDKIESIIKRYDDVLLRYIETENNNVLREIEAIADEAIRLDVSPEEIIALHKDIILENQLDTRQHTMALDVLYEMFVGYGFSYRDYKALVQRMERVDKEMEVASSLQSTMLKTNIPQLDNIQIGAISVPAHKVNGDYFNLIDHQDGTMSFAVADVIGKGIPAALAMSMIKFGMDSYGHSQLPCDGLKRLNRVVEKNVNQNMFVTMFYGLYEEVNHTLYYSSAGHEPGFIYRNKLDKFEEMTVRGTVLGVHPTTRYDQDELKLEIDDMVIVFTDGVSETRLIDGTFFEAVGLLEIIRKYKDLHPQDIVQVVYEEILKIGDVKKRDDLTILIIKRTK